MVHRKKSHHPHTNTISNNLWSTSKSTSNTIDPLNTQYVKPQAPTTDYTPFIIGGAIVLFFVFKKK